MERILATHAFTNQGAAATIITSDGSTGSPALSWHGTNTLRFRVAVSNKALWVKLFRGDVIAATAGTAGELHFPAGAIGYFVIGPEYDGVSIIGEDNTVDGSISIVDPS